jgi:hypothetical protein
MGNLSLCRAVLLGLRLRWAILVLRRRLRFDGIGGFCFMDNALIWIAYSTRARLLFLRWISLFRLSNRVDFG